MDNELVFENVPGKWSGLDYPTVSVTSVSYPRKGVVCAYAFMASLNIDFDGASNAYGPDELEPLDSLDNAGRYAATGYYGLMAVDPTQRVNPKDPKSPLIKDFYKLKLDARYPDRLGKQPVVQQNGDLRPGYFVSATPRATGNRYRQSSYMDSSSVAFGALSYLLQSKGVRMGNYGMVIRHDNGKQSGFNFWEAGHGKNSGDLAGRLGECSYKVFLDVGGTPKTRAQKYADNNFPTTFIVFPLASNSQLGLLANATNADDLPMLLAFYEQAAKGKSGKPLLDDWVAKGRTGARPKSYNRVLAALQGAGFSAATTPASTRPDWGDFPARGQAARMG